MRVATIVPIPHLELTRDDDYFLALAHLVHKHEYRSFFRRAAKRGAFVCMDNGVVETGHAATAVRLLKCAQLLEPDEVILPDELCDSERTLRRSMRALKFLSKKLPETAFMVVPQGKTRMEWIQCVQEMVEWPVATIGISRFLVNAGVYKNRLDALRDVPELLESTKDIHLLGCPGDLLEFSRIEQALPGRVRGVDSGIAAICAQEDVVLRIGAEKPRVELRFDTAINTALLENNISVWKHYASGGKA